MTHKSTEINTFWRIVALGILAYTTEQAYALPVLGPNDFRTQHTGLLLAQTGSSASQTVAPGASSDQVASIPSDDPCTASLTKAFDDKLVVDSPADVLVSFIEDYCVDAADEYLPKIVVPYFCFYSGSILVGQIKEAVTKQTTTKAAIIGDYCSAQQDQLFIARKKLIEKTLQGQPCIDTYADVYKDPKVVKFDPISREITARAMCAEFVKEINTLLDLQKSNLQNAYRYSYLISQQVDLETQQVDTYSGCIDTEAEKNPRQTCIDIMTEPGYFDIYNNQQKADVCQSAIMAWEDIKKRGGDSQPDACATLTSHVFQAYSWYLQDLSDGIIGAQTEKFSESLKKASVDAEAQKKEADVKMFLKQQKNQNAVTEGQKLVNEIQAANYESQVNQLKAEQAASVAQNQQSLQNIQKVESEIGNLGSLAAQPQQPQSQSQAAVAQTNEVNTVQTALAQTQALDRMNSMAVNNFLEGLNLAQAQANVQPAIAPQPQQAISDPMQLLSQTYTQPQAQMAQNQAQALAQAQAQPVYPQPAAYQNNYAQTNGMMQQASAQPQNFYQAAPATNNFAQTQQWPQPQPQPQPQNQFVQASAQPATMNYLPQQSNTYAQIGTQGQMMAAPQPQMMAQTSVQPQVMSQPQMLAQTMATPQAPQQFAQVASQSHQQSNGWLASPLSYFVGY